MTDPNPPLFPTSRHRARAAQLTATLALAAAPACALDGPDPRATTEGAALAGAAPDGAILSAFVGAVDQALIPFCPTRPAGAVLEGMPVVFDRQLHDAEVAPAAFTVISAAGARVTPACATLRPADEEDEDNTVLLVGDFGDGAIAGVEARGLYAEAPGGGRGAPLGDLAFAAVTQVTEGIFLVDAEVPADPERAGCPAGAVQVVRATWIGGLRALAADAAARVAVRTAAGAAIPLAGLAAAEETDNDNILDVCLASAAAPASIAVLAATYTGPNGVPNPATAIAVRAAAPAEVQP